MVASRHGIPLLAFTSPSHMVNILNYSNSFVNSAVYAIRIPKFHQALCSNRKRGEQPLRRNRSKEEIERLHLERH